MSRVLMAGVLCGILGLAGCARRGTFAQGGAPVVRVVGTQERDGVSVQDVEYPGAGGETVQAYLVLPAGGRRGPGVVYAHYAPGDRTTYLDEAVMLGRRGVASLVLSAPWSKREFWLPLFRDAAADHQTYVQVVAGLRRAVDVLDARPEVEGIGYVGHSFGASFGGILAAVEPRVRATVLIAGPPSFTDIAVINNPALTGEARTRYAMTMAPYDPVSVVGRVRRPLFFQLPRQDQLFSSEQLLRYSAAALEPEVRWYDGDHSLKSTQARDERIEWLLQKL
jgi:dienelactone hydrolase